MPKRSISLELFLKQEHKIALNALLEVIQIQVLHHVFNVLQENILKKNHQNVMIVKQEHIQNLARLLA